jgi:hypothetical protein
MKCYMKLINEMNQKLKKILCWPIWLQPSKKEVERTIYFVTLFEKVEQEFQNVSLSVDTVTERSRIFWEIA